MIRTLHILLTILLITSPAQIIFGQGNSLVDKNRLNNQKSESQIVFDEIQTGISESNVAALSGYFSPQTYLSLSNGVSGYYSSNQAYYVLEEYFKVYQITSFRFNNIRNDETSPYATGVYSYDLKGKRDTARVYISLKKTGNRWKISQITFN
ncbi:MAG: DUF4783 domain-containing protein [Ignavibacteriales bacterium]|nr:MAG: DUF4783 domain-containing protein [Ignavibacteriales bacterium]